MSQASDYLEGKVLEALPTLGSVDFSMDPLLPVQVDTWGF